MFTPQPHNAHRHWPRWKQWLGKIVAAALVLAGVLGIMSCQPLHAQERLDNVWHYGPLLTVAGDTVEVEYMINFDSEVVQARQQDRQVVFTARQINYLAFKDQETGVNRIVMSLPFASSPTAYRVPRFFELEYETSHLSLFSRERLVSDADMAWNPYTGNTMMRPVRRLVKDYYIRRQDGLVFQVKGRRKDLLHNLSHDLKGNPNPMLPDLKAYVDKESVDLYDPLSLRKFIDHYASLCTTASKTP